MTDAHTTETAASTAPTLTGLVINWNRIEGIVGAVALVTSFIWFLGMPTGMAIGVGVGTVLLLDFFRALIFDSSSSSRSHQGPAGTTRH